MASTVDQHHSKKGSLTNVFTRLFKSKDKVKGGTNEHREGGTTNDPGESTSNTPTHAPQAPQLSHVPHTPHAPQATHIPPQHDKLNTNDATDKLEQSEATSKQTEQHPPTITLNIQSTGTQQTLQNPSKLDTPPSPRTEHAQSTQSHETDSTQATTKPEQVKVEPIQETSTEQPKPEDTEHTNNNNRHSGESHVSSHLQDEYIPLPFNEGSPRGPTNHPQQNQQNAQKPRSSGPPEILPEEIEYDSKADFLGQGSFGSVYKGRCRGQEVAVKIPRKQKLTLSELTSFRNEVKIMSKIYHPNVVLFLGACTQMGKMQIVTERCMTDLEKLLASKRTLSLYERMRMAKDAALGMNWLHGITRIVHNDLKSANLLVDNHMRVKVTDFGFSQIKEGDQFVDKSKKGTPLWMAPEVMLGQPYDDKADVYSFGIILWEIVTRDVPYKHHRDYNTFFRAVCYDHERPPLPADIMPSLKYLITSCWDHNQTVRPSFNAIVFRISEVMVECMIENDSARQLWKQYFLLPKQELVEQVGWSDFSACLCQNLGLKGPKDSNETLLSHIKSLLVTLPRDTMGLVKEVVTMERFDKAIKWFGIFFDPVVGVKVINEINLLATKSWFYWDISRDESISRLSNQEDGTFLIRLSSTDPKVTPFTLSLTGNQHRRIKRVTEGYKIQGKPKVYTNLQDLVDNCEDYNLKIPCPKVDTSNPYEMENFA